MGAKEVSRQPGELEKVKEHDLTLDLSTGGARCVTLATVHRTSRQPALFLLPKKRNSLPIVIA
ncbi:hypothetical protein E2C01_001128 [Portunus trituberculatus]|uniref:Uncharacterized protein n=1 Tax=Portunus trituberculatus TaxID=210409 RepID=A0A5B7CGT9_PORTR|nr:hypothetical protein [Portunus trituberculatus]